MDFAFDQMRVANQSIKGFGVQQIKNLRLGQFVPNEPSFTGRPWAKQKVTLFLEGLGQLQRALLHDLIFGIVMPKIYKNRQQVAFLFKYLLLFVFYKTVGDI